MKGSDVTPSKGNFAMILTFALVWGLLFSAAAGGAEFAGGTGEPDDSYRIATTEQLIAVGSSLELMKQHYVLAASIDMSGVICSGPVISTIFGTFDGNGHTIRNLRIESDGWGGLFGLIRKDAEVRDLGVVNVQVLSMNACGGLVEHNTGMVVNCYSTGAVISMGGVGAGGLAGLNSGTITDSYSTAAVIGSRDVGGLVGQNTGRVASCHSTGEVTALGIGGGLVGSNTGEITSSYCVATVTAQHRAVGGLVGLNRGRLTSSYSGSTVVGQDARGPAGGLAGDNGGSILSCYSTGSVTGGDFVGGLVGDNTGNLSASYSIAAVSGQGQQVGALVGDCDVRGMDPAELVGSSYFLAGAGGGPDNGIGIPLTDTQMRQQASFAGFDFWGTTQDGKSDPWYMPKARYPVLAWQVGVSGLEAVPDVSGMPLDEAVVALEAAGFVVGEVSYDFHRTIPVDCVICADPHSVAAAGATIDLVLSSGGTYDWTTAEADGTADSPYEIQTAGQLESLADYPELWDRHFVLSADLDMINRTYPTALIAPDMDRSKSGFQGAPFSGTFDGQGHVIRNLTIHHVVVHHEYVGLFGMIAPGGRVEDLKLVDADVEGGIGTSSIVGILAGHNAGTVANCSASGLIHGGSGDGLVGFNSGTLTGFRVDITRI